MKSLRLLLMVFIFAGLDSGRALAAGADHGARADGHIQRGLELRKQGEDEAALAEFEAAVALTRSGRALAQVALAEQALGLWVDAEEHLTSALAMDDGWVARNRPHLEGALREIAGHLATLDIDGAVFGATIKVNGQPRGTVPLAKPLRVASGSLTVEVEAPGHFPLVRTVLVVPGGRARETVSLVPISRASAAAEPPPAAAARSDTLRASAASPAPDGAADWSWQKVVGVSALAATAIPLAYALVTYLAHESQYASLRDRDPPCTVKTCMMENQDLEDKKTRITFALVGAAALGVTGGTFLWLAPEPGAESPRLSLGYSGRF